MLTRWDPFAEMASLHEAMRHLLDDSALSSPSRGVQAGTGIPFDLYEAGDNVVFRAALPGVDPQTLDITVEQGTLTVQGTRQVAPAAPESGLVWHHSGLTGGRFQIRTRLPVPVSADAAEATCAGGMLTVSLPKAEEARPRRINIRDGGARQQAISAAEAGR